MRRRALLGLVGASTVGLAGCTGDAPSGGSTDSPEPTDTPTDSPTATGSPTPEPGALTVEDRQFEALATECGEGANSARVSHEATGEDTGRITVDGVVRGSDTCHSARLVGAVAEGDSLRVSVESYVPEENEEVACAECIVDVSYRAVLDYAGSGPFEVVVDHGGEQVVTSGPYPDGGGGETVQY
jgi:hypothetical protein